MDISYFKYSHSYLKNPHNMFQICYGVPVTSSNKGHCLISFKSASPGNLMTCRLLMMRNMSQHQIKIFTHLLAPSRALYIIQKKRHPAQRALAKGVQDTLLNFLHFHSTQGHFGFFGTPWYFWNFWSHLALFDTFWYLLVLLVYCDKICVYMMTKTMITKIILLWRL